MNKENWLKLLVTKDWAVKRSYVIDGDKVLVGFIESVKKQLNTG